MFTEGTILYHKTAKNQPREAIVQQVKDKDPSTQDFTTYIPISNAQNKLQLWSNQGHQILYLTSRKKIEEIGKIKEILSLYNFPEGQLLHRSDGKEYQDVVEKNLPDILIEDDCESIGGLPMTVYPKIRSDIQKRVFLVSVREFAGIDDLPDDILDLIRDDIRIR